MKKTVGRDSIGEARKPGFSEAQRLVSDFAFVFYMKPLEGFAYCFRIKVEKFHASLV